MPHYFHSEKQNKQKKEHGKLHKKDAWSNYIVRPEDGALIEFTEKGQNPTTKSKWDDMRYLGYWENPKEKHIKN